MTDNTIWLIHHKLKIGERSPLNMDGSKFASAIGVVSANSLVGAIIKLDNFLSTQLLELADISQCEIYTTEKYPEDSDDNQDIREAVREITDEPEKVTWVRGETLSE